MNKKLVENFIIIIGISIVLTFIPNILFPGWRYLKYFGFLASIFFYYIFFSKADSTYHYLSDLLFRKTNQVIFFIVCFFSIEIIRSLIMGDLTFLRAGVLLLSHTGFILFLRSITKNKLLSGKNHNEILLILFKPYVFLSVLIVMLSMFVFVLISFNVIDPYNYTIPNILGYEFFKEVKWGNENFKKHDLLLFPLFLTIISPRLRILDVGMPINLLGWSYEPHVATFFLTPSVFILHFYINSFRLKLILYFGYLIFILGAASVANLIALIVVGFVFMLNKIRFKNIHYFVASFVAIYFAFSYLFYQNQNIRLMVSNALSFLEYKIFESDSTSADVTLTMNSYILSPSSIFGDGFLKIPDLFTVAYLDIGLVGTIFYILIFIFLLYQSFILNQRGSYLNRSISFVIIYFMVHSLKFPMHIINYPFSTYIIFITIFSSFSDFDRRLD